MAEDASVPETSLYPLPSWERAGSQVSSLKSDIKRGSLWKSRIQEVP